MASFDKRSQRKIVDNIRYVSRSPRVVPEARRRYPIGGGGGGMVAKVKTAISARSGQTAGHGVVNFEVLGDDGIYVIETEDITVYNPYGASIAVGRWVTLVSAPGGWHVFGADCP